MEELEAERQDSITLTLIQVSQQQELLILVVEEVVGLQWAGLRILEVMEGLV